jgi:hypothetical protein
MKTKYILCNYLLLRDDFRIGLIISPMVALLAWGEAEYTYDNFSVMKTKYILYNYLLLRDDFRIGLVISPRVAVLAWGEAEAQ